jgi:hypothetical protein
MTESSIITKAKVALSSPSRPTLKMAMLMLDDNWEPDLSGLDAQLASAFWQMAKRDEETPWLDTCWLLYHLKQQVKANVLINGEARTARVERWMTWESTLAQRASEHPTYEWAWFCENRLDINSNTASSRKRIWEVFAVTLGWTEEQMLSVGKAKLAQSASLVEKDWKRGKVDEELMALLLGDGDVEPGTFAQVQEHVSWRKDQDKVPEKDVVHDYRLAGEFGDREREIIDWLRRPNEVQSQPYVVGKLIRYEQPGMMKHETGEGAGTLQGEEAQEAWVELVERIEK